MAPKLALLVPPQPLDTPVKVEDYHREAAAILAQYGVTPADLERHSSVLGPGYAAALQELAPPWTG